MTTAADQVAFVGERLQLSVDEFQRAFDARKIPKAVSKAKEMRTRMEYGMEVTLENMLADIVKEAQTKAFWNKLDEAVVELCDQRNSWLDEVFIEQIVPEIENMIAGVEDHFRFPGRPNGRMDINAFFEIQLNAISDWIIRLGAAIADGPGPDPLSHPGRLLPRGPWALGPGSRTRPRANGTIQDSWPFSPVLPIFR